jgi:hypothetical protein
MVGSIYKVFIRIGAVVCFYSLMLNVFSISDPLKGSAVIDCLFIAVWVASEYQWRKEKGE